MHYKKENFLHNQISFKTKLFIFKGSYFSKLLRKQFDKKMRDQER